MCSQGLRGLGVEKGHKNPRPSSRMDIARASPILVTAGTSYRTLHDNQNPHFTRSHSQTHAITLGRTTTQVSYIIQPSLAFSSSIRSIRHDCGERGFYKLNWTPRSTKKQTWPVRVFEHESTRFSLSSYRPSPRFLLLVFLHVPRSL
jgi:hypothetical protein